MKILILDTNEKNIEVFRTIIKQNYPGWQVFYYATAFAFVTAIYDEFKGDIGLALIYLKGACDENIEMGKEVQNYFPHIRIIFYSETGDCAEEIFRAKPIFFLRLPLKKSSLETALLRVNTELNEDSKQMITIYSNGQMRKLRHSKIRYIESESRKILLYTDDGSFDTYMTMEVLLARLPDSFFRCHRSYVVNLDRVIGMESGLLFLSSDEAVPVSRTYQKEIRGKIRGKKC